MVDVCKELSDIAFENPACVGMVLGYLISKGSKAIEGFVCSLSQLAGEGIGDEFL